MASASADNKGNLVFPNPLISPKQKDYKYIMQYGKAMWYTYLRYNSNIGYINRTQYEINRMYSMGIQDIEQYKNIIDIKDGKDGSSYLNLDWSQLAVMHKYANIFRGLMTNTNYKITANAINPIGIDKRNQAKLKDMFNFQFKDKLAELNQYLGVEEQPQQANKPEFSSLEEVELYYEHDYKLDEEMAAIDGWNIIAETNDWNNEIKEQLSADLFDYGICGTRDYVDSNGVIKIRRINPENLVMGWSDRLDFKDCPHFGEVVFKTVSELKQLTSASPQELDEAGWEKLAKSCLGNWNNPLTFVSMNTYNTSIGRPYDGIRIPCLDFEFESVNRYEYVTEKDHTGNDMIIETDPTLGTVEEDSVYNRKRIRKDIKVLYTGVWVMGTDIIFDAGLAQNLKRRNGSLQDVMSNFHLYAPTKKGMRVKSLVEMCIPLVNNIHISWFKLQAAMAQATPKGLAIDINAITGIVKGMGGETWNPLDIIELRQATGTLLYRSVDDEGRPLGNGRLPIQEQENGMAQDIFRYIDIINNNHKMIYDLMGFNEVSAGGTPNPETGKAQSEMAIQATNNALKPLFKAYTSVLERTARSCIQRLQDTSKNGVKGYEQSLGAMNMAVLGAFPDLSMWDFGIIIEQAPSDQEIQLLDAMAQRELSVREQGGAGGITFADYLTIRDVMKYNLKKAARLLDQRKKISAMEFAKMQQANSQANSQAQAEASMAASKQAMEMQMQMDKFKFEMKLQGDMQLQQMKDQMAIQKQLLANEGILEKAEMDNTTAIIIADSKNHTNSTIEQMGLEYQTLHNQLDREHEMELNKSLDEPKK
jgi:hypothetical protein